tara:strand:- start:232 stop:810 length:579 start_codon:yes stop_codon:yes gene_type:complete
MKKLILILILTLSFQTLTKADDIRDFEIEGISIGDSLLDYFSEEEITKTFYYKSKKYFSFTSSQSSFKTYDGVQFHIKNNDKTYTIEAIEGVKLFQNKINECKKLKKVVVGELSSLFIDAEKENDSGTHDYDKTGNSKFFRTMFFTSPKDRYNSIEVACFDWSKILEKQYGDKLTVGIKTQIFQKFMDVEAY